MKNGKKTKKSRIAVFIIFTLIAVVTLGACLFGYTLQNGDYAGDTLDAMRTYAIMRTAVGSIIDELVQKAKTEAKQYADSNNYSRNARSAYMVERGEIARTAAEQKYAGFDGVDTSNLRITIDALEDALRIYSAKETKEKQAFAEIYTALIEAVPDWTDWMDESKIAYERGDEASDSLLWSMLLGSLPALELQENTHYRDSILRLCYDLVKKEMKADAAEAEDSQTLTDVTQEAEDTGVIEVDYRYFTESEALSALKPAIEDAYNGLWNELSLILPDLTDDRKEDLETSLISLTYQRDANFDARYNSYTNANGDHVLTQRDKSLLRIAYLANDLFTIGTGVLLFAVVYLFYHPIVKKLGVPRLIIAMFFIYLCLFANLYGIDVPSMLGNVLRRTGMYGVLALAILPGIQCGIGLNLGMTIGCIAGLLSTMIALEMGLSGADSFLFALLVGCVFAVPLGWAYAKLLNRMKGNEMTVSTYVGFSFVALMCIAWMWLPFKNTRIIWILSGYGLRVTHSLKYSFSHILNNLWSFEFFGATIPTGLLLFFLACCGSVWLFTRSRTGAAMIAVGSNPRFAEAAGVNVNRMRIVGTVFSTVIAAIGIVVYSQAFGYVQLYTAPRQQGFIAASAILIGGATVSRGKLSHVIVGTFLFQGVLALGTQVANAAVAGGGLSEVMRIMISNGIILYALTQSGGESHA